MVTSSRLPTLVCFQKRLIKTLFLIIARRVAVLHTYWTSWWRLWSTWWAITVVWDYNLILYFVWVFFLLGEWQALSTCSKIYQPDTRWGMGVSSMNYITPSHYILYLGKTCFLLCFFTWVHSTCLYTEPEKKLLVGYQWSCRELLVEGQVANAPPKLGSNLRCWTSRFRESLL